MSKVLETLKVDIVRARNLSYFGKYQESVASFSKIITIIEAEIFRMNDKILLEEWNKLLEEIKYEKDLTSAMLETLDGNF